MRVGVVGVVVAREGVTAEEVEDVVVGFGCSVGFGSDGSGGAKGKNVSLS